MQRIISGIQQVGIGVANADAAFSWYNKMLGMDVVVFNDEATAALMTQYTGHKAYNRKAILAMNMAGGGGFEIWQYTDKTPTPPLTPPQLGDLGIFAIKLKCVDAARQYALLKSQGVQMLTSLHPHSPTGFHFFVKDPFGNVFEIIECTHQFSKKYGNQGGVAGITIGVSNMETSIEFYKEVLGYNQILHRSIGQCPDFEGLNGSSETFERTLLTHSENRTGAFAKLLGKTYIELLQITSKKTNKIYENRFWGDPGFIHVCFDINGMDAHEKICLKNGYPLTVNSKNSFTMGKAAGHFAYNQDPDGTLIEYVETHKLPILKKLGWYLDLRKRNPQKFLPNWMVHCLRFSRVKK